MQEHQQLNRRDFIKTGGATVAGLTLLRGAGFAQTSVELSPRRVYALNHRWLWSETAAPDATSPTLKDAAWQRVTIPHTNKILPWHGFDDKDYQFVSAYRRHFKLPAEARGRRVFVDFGGVMTAARVFINGHDLGEYRGGYTNFSYELTPHLNANPNADNVLAVIVDSTERKDIPPFGGEIDYLTFGGIYRDVALRVVNEAFIENVFAKPLDVLTNKRRIEVKCYLQSTPPAPRRVQVELFDSARVIATASRDVAADEAAPVVTLENLVDAADVKLWDLDAPQLYGVRVRLYEGKQCVDHYETRIGLREAKFTPEGFLLNGKPLKLRGLNRHQTFPYVGQAMPARVQRRDAWILRHDLNCNIVRTSHYPQSPHFLDACDEIGLLVLEEIPGWQHIGNKDWQDLSVQYVSEMVRRDWNHPSIILWGVRINESGDNREFYVRTNKTARDLDNSRQTGGIRNKYDSELLEDVFTMNDFRLPLRPPNHPLYLNTEFIGHMYPTKRNDNIERITEHAMRHARIHNQIGGDKQYAGGIGWCAFDYNTHSNFCSGDRICYHGVADIFRIPKPSAGIYLAQQSPSKRIVLEPAFDWSRGDRDESFNVAFIASNCEQIKIYINKRLVADITPDRKNFPHLAYPPFITNIREGLRGSWGDLTLEGYIGGKLLISKKMSGLGVDQQLLLEADDSELFGDGRDATRMVLKVTDEYGAVRPFANAALALKIEGPGEIVGENPFALFGGVGAVWVKTKEAVGLIKLTATHPVLGSKSLEIKVNRPPETPLV